MISVTQLRNGVCFAENDIPWRVMTYQHTHLSRGSGTIRVKCRNLITGQVLNKTFKSGDRVDDIAIEKRIMQYLYKDGMDFYFMDPKSFDQIILSEKVVGEAAIYLKEGEEVSVMFWDDRALYIDLPPKMIFKIKEAAPGEKGDSASNVYKDAVLENGLRIRVPLFVNEGEMIRVDTRTGEYIERA